MNDFLNCLQNNARLVDNQVEKSLADFSKYSSKISPKLNPLIKLLLDSCRGGKRIRGVLVRLGYKLARAMAGAKLDHLEGGEEIVKVAAAFEILHASILIHDDVIDQSPLRRGKKTLYMALRPEDGRVGADHYGISQAIGLADIGLFLAVKIIADTNFPLEQKSQALSFFAQTVINTGLGEVLDVEIPHLGGERREEDVVTIHKLKTAYYTISAPLKLGAILSGARLDFLHQLDQFGESLGIAFQIQDDILGVFGDEKQLGKSVTSDVEEGKNTLLITYALEKANSKQKQILNNLYGKNNLTPAEFNQIKQIFVSGGALDYSKKQALSYVTKAKKIIPSITKDVKMSIILSQMADYLVERTK